MTILFHLPETLMILWKKKKNKGTLTLDATCAPANIRYPLADQIYRTSAHRNYCKDHGIRLSGSKLGRANVNAKADKKQEYQDNTDRIEVERTFSLSKRCYGMGCIVTKLKETQLTSIALSVFVTNLFKIQKRILCVFLSLFRFLHRLNSCKRFSL